MKHFFIIIILLSLFGCGTKEEKEPIQQIKSKSDHQLVKKENMILLDSSSAEEKIIKDSITNQKTDSNEKENTNKKIKARKNSNPSVTVDEIVFASQERKEPLIIQSIDWSNKELVLTYKKTVYPMPDVGCSSSNEIFVLRVPISKPEGQIILNNEQLQNSSLNYNYSGGLYEKNSLDTPPSGKIVLSPQETGNWNVDIDIKFQVEEMGGLNQEKRDENFKLTGVFKQTH